MSICNEGLIGHSRDTDTEGVYGHLMAGDMEKTAQFSEKAFAAILKQA